MTPLDVTAPGFHRRALSIEELARTGGTVELERELVARGVVVDDRGDSVPLALVRLSQETDDDRSAPRRSARCDPWGRFTVDRLRPGSWRVEAFAEGLVGSDPEGLVVRLDGDAQPALRLTMVRRETPRRATITGEVVSAGRGEPVRDLDFGGIGGASVVLDGARFRVAGLAPTRVRLLARAPGFEAARLESVDLAPGALVDIGRVELRPATRLEVVVRGAGGGLLRDAEVRLVRLPRKEAGRGGLPPSLTLSHQGGGRYVHGSVPRARWRLEVRHPLAGASTREVDVRGARKRVRVDLAR